MVMELFFILIKWSRYPGYDTVLQFWKMSPLGKLGKEYIESLSIISDNCMWIYNYLKIKGLVKKKEYNKILKKDTPMSDFPK